MQCGVCPSYHIPVAAVQRASLQKQGNRCALFLQKHSCGVLWQCLLVTQYTPHVPAAVHGTATPTQGVSIAATGPGYYHKPLPAGVGGPAFTMAPRLPRSGLTAEPAGLLPGPGQYEVARPCGEAGAAFTIAGRLVAGLEQQQEQTPGPGALCPENAAGTVVMPKLLAAPAVGMVPRTPVHRKSGAKFAQHTLSLA